MLEIIDKNVTLARFDSLERAIRFINEYFSFFGESLQIRKNGGINNGFKI